MADIDLALESKEEFRLVKPNINLRGSFIVEVTAVSDPGKFYVLPNYRIEAMNLNCTNPLQKLAPNSSLPVEIFPNQIYAVLSSDHKWSRALVGPPSGKFQVKYLEFFMYKYKYVNHFIAFSGRKQASGNALQLFSARFWYS